MMRRISLSAALFGVLLGACSHTPEAKTTALVEAPVPPAEETGAVSTTDAEAEALTPRERAQRAIQLLDAGMEDEAGVELQAMLDANPQNAIALKLREQIDADPQDLLGPDYEPYTVAPGETLSSLAKTHLGDALLFYALSRYNDLAAPNRLMAGQTLKMPLRADEPVEPVQEVAEVEEETETPVVDVAETAEVGDTLLVDFAMPTDKVTANALRLQGLQELNAGNSERATTLLRRAHSLDKENPNIAADLAKAERIEAAVKQTN